MESSPNKSFEALSHASSDNLEDEVDDFDDEGDFVIPPPKIPPLPFNFVQTGKYDIISKEGFEKLKKHISNYVDNIEALLQETFDKEEPLKTDKADDDKTTTVLLLNALRKADLIISEVDRPAYKQKIDLEMEGGEEVTLTTPASSPKRSDKLF